MLLAERLRLAYTTLPSAQAWVVVCLILGIYAGLSLLIVRGSSVLKFQKGRLTVGQILALAAIAIFSPSLLEETLYRGLLLPHPTEGVALSESLLWHGISLSLFVLSHPFIARFVWPWSRFLFYNAGFLTIVCLLGLSTSFSYSYTGSIWPPVFIHWFTIVMWKSFFGGPDFNLSKSS